MLTRDERLRFGVCWYPDHWPRERWAEDVRLMREAGLECVRWGEGSWTLMQPAAGRFEWSFVDEVLELCARSGLGVILGTPTYAAPAWLEEAHPEIIALRENGTPWYRHSRRYYDYTQPAYRDACDAIVSAMAARYRGDERIWAWQLDNEMWCHLGELWGPSVRAAFQSWLARRYGDIAALNAAWGLRFWSNQLDHFAQADLPGPTTAYLNHHQCADYRHFLSDLALDFLRGQRERIQTEDPQALVLHNCPFGPIDRAALLQELDIYGHDHYPRFAGPAQARPAMALNYGRFRPYARRLWVVEQQASQVGQTSYRLPAAPPGELSVTALQSVAHGCNLVAWFRWRSFPAAQETNWGGLLPHWGVPGRHYDEARELITALSPHLELIASTRPDVAVARLLSYRQQVAADVEPWIGEHLGSSEGGRAALRRLGLNEDTLRPGDVGLGPLAASSSEQTGGQGAGEGRYVLALLPLAVALDEAEVLALEVFVSSGGVLVIGPLAGHRCTKLQGPSLAEPPGALARLTGTASGEATTLDEAARLRSRGSSVLVEATRYAELLAPREPDTEVLAEYAAGWFAGSAAVTRRGYGAGWVLHCGVALSDPVLDWLLREPLGECLSSRAPAVSLPSPEAEVLCRRNRSLALHFVLNHGEQPVACQLRRAADDLLTGQAVPQQFELPARGYRILRERL